MYSEITVIILQALHMLIKNPRLIVLNVHILAAFLMCSCKKYLIFKYLSTQPLLMIFINCYLNCRSAFGLQIRDVRRLLVKCIVELPLVQKPKSEKEYRQQFSSVCMCVHTYVCACVCVSVCVCVHVYVCVCMCVCVCTYIYMYVYVRTCVCI